MNTKLVPINLLIFLILFSSCIPMKAVRKWTSVKVGAIPTDFGATETTLLILSGKGRLGRSIEKNVPLYYKGKYEYVPENNLSKFIKNAEYKYILLYEMEFMGANGEGKMVPIFHLENFRTNTKYKTKMNTDNFSKMLIGYLQNLENARKK